MGLFDDLLNKNPTTPPSSGQSSSSGAHTGATGQQGTGATGGAQQTGPITITSTGSLSGTSDPMAQMTTPSVPSQVTLPSTPPPTPVSPLPPVSSQPAPSEASNFLSGLTPSGSSTSDTTSILSPSMTLSDTSSESDDSGLVILSTETESVPPTPEVSSLPVTPITDLFGGVVSTPAPLVQTEELPSVSLIEETPVTVIADPTPAETSPIGIIPTPPLSPEAPQRAPSENIPQSQPLLREPEIQEEVTPVVIPDTRTWLQRSIENIMLVLSNIRNRYDGKIREEKRYKAEKERFAELEKQAHKEAEAIIQEQAQAEKMKEYLKSELSEGKSEKKRKSTIKKPVTSSKALPEKAISSSPEAKKTPIRKTPVKKASKQDDVPQV